MFSKSFILFIYLITALYACNGQKKNNIMQNVIDFEKKEIIPNVQRFESQPLYAAQINKNNCRVLITCNDIPHWITFYDNAGESMLVYLNTYIPKSGSQLLTVQIYPKEGDEFIAPDAAVDIRLTSAPDKHSSLTEYTNLLDTSLNDVLKDQKLKYYEFKLPFEATVPFNFSQELEESTNLKALPNIQEMVFKKYNQLRQYLINGEIKKYLQEDKNSQLRTASYLYATKEELLSDLNEDNIKVNMFNIQMSSREVLSLEYCELIFGYHGKLVLLRNTRTKDAALKVITNKGKENEEELSSDVILYMPGGSNELKIW